MMLFQVYCIYGAVSGLLLSGNTGIENSFSGTDDSCPYSIKLPIPIEFRGQYFYKMFVSHKQQFGFRNGYALWPLRSTSHERLQASCSLSTICKSLSTCCKPRFHCVSSTPVRPVKTSRYTT